ncbi:MAG: fasciclin domain-containing protein [Candidatus Nanopelagicales bacterium]
MNLRLRTAAVTAAAALAATGVALAPASSAAPAPAAKAAAPTVVAAETGTRSLAAVLTANGGGTLDKNWKDYDIVTKAVVTVLTAKPSSPVSALTDGSVALTAFIPNDRAFQVLVQSLTGKKPKTEKATFKAVAKLGVNTIETVLLYHVVVGPAIDSSAALKANGAKLKTAAGLNLTVKVTKKPAIILIDKDRNARNARVILSQVDINKGNAQIAHGIDRVLRPVNLPNKHGIS